MRLAILASHPVQYQTPWFRRLANETHLEVFFAHRQSAEEQGRSGFGVAFDWDLDLLSGYKNEFLNNISKTPSVNWYEGCDTPEIQNIISDKQFDAFIVCGWYLKSYLQAARACRAVKIPILVRGDSHLKTPRPVWKRWLLEIRQRWLFRRFDGFLSVGQRHKEYLDHYSVPAKRIYFVPHFVDNDWFSSRAVIAHPKRRELQANIKISPNSICVLFCGKFISVKQPQELVRAIQATGSVEKFHLVFVGGGELGKQLRDSCNVVFDAESGISEVSSARLRLPRASFVGFKNQSELPSIYALADVMVLPSRSETWGLVVNEAMACGVPAIVSDVVGCAPDLIDEAKTGFTYPVGDVDGLAKKILEFVKLKEAEYDFNSALSAKMRIYNVGEAVKGTIHAIKSLTSHAHG